MKKGMRMCRVTRQMGRKGKKYGTNYESQSPSTQGDRLRGLETEETQFHRDANTSTSLQTCLGFNLKIFLVYATHECTTYN